VVNDEEQGGPNHCNEEAVKVESADTRQAERGEEPSYYHCANDA